MDEEEQRLGLGVVTHSEYIVSEGSVRGLRPQEAYFVQCCGFYLDGWKRKVLAGPLLLIYGCKTGGVCGLD
jgi:hypothetical protein